jgi:hypothetical protein
MATDMSFWKRLSEVQSKKIFMGHQILSCHVPVVQSFFIFRKTLLLSQNLPYDHLPKYTIITFVRILTAWLQGIQPCELKGNGYQSIGNQVFRLAEEEKKRDLWKRSPKTFWGI